MQKNKYLSIPQVAKILRISRTAVYKKVKKGELRAIRIGRGFAIPQECIMQKMRKITGIPLSEKEKSKIRKVVKKTINEYGEVLIMLGSE